MNTQILRFLVSGGTAAAIEYATFITLRLAFDSPNLALAQSLSFLAGLLTSFALNRSWVFKSTANASDQFIRYAVLAAINLLIGNLAITALVSLGINPYLAKLLVMAMIAAWNYLIFSTHIFKNRKAET